MKPKGFIQLYRKNRITDETERFHPTYKKIKIPDEKEERYHS
jgi:hypothetical protein